VNFFFDESGNFRVPTTVGTHAVGIVSGVVIPEAIEAAVLEAFDRFLKTLPSTAFDNGEVKGRLLDDDARRRLADLIVHLPAGILFCPIMLDLTSLIGISQASVGAAIAAKLIEIQGTCKHATQQDEIGQLAADIGRMSDPQVLRLATWAKCISRCINDSVIFHSVDVYHPSWSSLRFEIDPVQQRGGTEKDAFEFLLPAWVTAWSHDEPLTTIEGIHTAEHPFVKNWTCPAGIDVGKIFKRNVHYIPSDKSLGIQLADVTATLVRKAVIGLATAANLQNYGFMLTRTIGEPYHAAGMFFLAPHEVADIERRYKGIADAINAARTSIRTSYCN
jgi:hypothetical protein